MTGDDQHLRSLHKNRRCQMAVDDGQIKGRKIAEVVGILKESDCHMSTEELEIRKLNARLVPPSPRWTKMHASEHFQGFIAAV